MAPLDAKVKHIILLTDGEAPRGPYEDLASQMEGAQITVSTVGIGADADTNLLQELANLGHGRYYDGNDPFDLPQLLVKETQQVQRAAIVEEDFTPLVVSSDPATQGIDIKSAPQLKGYVATTPKPQSTVLLASRELDPVLSQWQYGLGRVMAWTSDANNVWASRWLEWPDFGKFWAQLVKRVDRPPEDPNRQVTVKIDADQGAHHAGRADRRRAARPRTTSISSRRQAVLVDPNGAQSTVQLPQVAPGRYEATVPVQSDGVYTLTATQTDPTTGEQAVQSSGFVVPYSPEYGLTGTNQTLLQVIARQTGGGLISDPNDAFAHTLPSVGAPQPLWPLLLLLAAILLVGDVGVRRVRISAPEIRAGYSAIRRRLGYVDERPDAATRPFIAPIPRGARGVAHGRAGLRAGRPRRVGYAWRPAVHHDTVRSSPSCETPRLSPLVSLASPNLTDPKHRENTSSASVSRTEHARRRVRQHVEQPIVGVLAHQLAVVDQLQHKNQHHGQQHAVQELRRDDDLDQRQARDQHERRADGDQRGVQRVEDRRLRPRPRHATLPAERAAHRVRRAERQHARRQHARAEQPEPEQQIRVRPGQRLERARGVLGGVDDHAVDVQRRGRRDDDEHGDDRGQQRADDHVGAFAAVVARCRTPLSVSDDCR